MGANKRSDFYFCPFKEKNSVAIHIEYLKIGEKTCDIVLKAKYSNSWDPLF